MTILVVGGSLAGLRAAESLVAQGVPDQITIVSTERHPPYNRPPLSKTALSLGSDAADLTLRSRYPDHPQLDWRLGRSVISCDLAGGSAHLDIAEVITWRGLIVAAGLRPRRLSLPGPTQGRHALRTIDDVQRLRRDAQTAHTAIVLGAGVLGCELAMTLSALGLLVTLIDPYEGPMTKAIGPVAGADLQQRMLDCGARIIVGSSPVAFTGNGRVRGVDLDDGSSISGDLVIEAVGATPNTEWLQGNGIDLTDGVLCTNDLAVAGTDRVVACGDIACFPHPTTGRTRRTEHWTMATETARRSANTLVRQLNGQPAADGLFAPTPYFWSTLGNIEIHCIGWPELGEHTTILHGHPNGDVTYLHTQNGAVVGITSFGSHRAQRHSAMLGTPALNSTTM